jgi:hypothetical protein
MQPVQPLTRCTSLVSIGTALRRWSRHCRQLTPPRLAVLAQQGQ